MVVDMVRKLGATHHSPSVRSPGRLWYPTIHHYCAFLGAVVCVVGSLVYCPSAISDSFHFPGGPADGPGRMGEDREGLGENQSAQGRDGDGASS